MAGGVWARRRSRGAPLWPAAFGRPGGAVALLYGRRRLGAPAEPWRSSMAGGVWARRRSRGAPLWPAAFGRRGGAVALLYARRRQATRLSCGAPLRLHPEPRVLVYVGKMRATVSGGFTWESQPASLRAAPRTATNVMCASATRR